MLLAFRPQFLCGRTDAPRLKVGTNERRDGVDDQCHVPSSAPRMVAPRYTRISEMGNRVTIVTSRACAGSAPALRRARRLPKASAALRKFPLPPTHRR